MALRNQPYIPLYVQDVLTDEKLALCSAEAHGIYFLLLCILHKQDVYGKICLKQKHKQNPSKYHNFALLLSRQMPFEQKQIMNCLIELEEEKVISITDDALFQKRMIKDGELSEIRAIQGKKGGSNVTKQYGKQGYLYLMSDGYTKNKIGVSVNPQNRLYRLRSDLKLDKLFDIQRTVIVDDMGKSEDIAHEHFREILDGEWLIGDYETIIDKFILLETKLKTKRQAKKQAKGQAKCEANSENEIEYENEVENIYDIIIEYLNQKIDTNYKSSTKITKEHINARIKEGFTIDNFKTVIDKKSFEWKNNPSMAKFLRPQTLFGTKFENYLNQPWYNGEKVSTTEIAIRNILAEESQKVVDHAELINYAEEEIF